MFDLTARRLRMVHALCEDSYLTRSELSQRLEPDAAKPVLSYSDQQSLAKLAEAGLIEARENPERQSAKDSRWQYRRTEAGMRLVNLLELDKQEPFILTIRRLRILNCLYDDTYLSRTELCGFLMPEETAKKNLVLPVSDQESLKLLTDAGLIDARREPGRPNPRTPRWLYRRTEKGTELLDILGIEPEE